MGCRYRGQLHESTWKIRVHLYTGGTTHDLALALRRRGVEADRRQDPQWKVQGRTYFAPQGLFVWVKRASDWPTLAHELLHVVTWALADRMPLTHTHDELYCHMLQDLSEQARKLLKA